MEVRDLLYDGSANKAVRYSFDAAGDLVSMIDQADHETTYSVLRPGGSGFPSGVGSDVTRVETETDPDGVSTRTLFDRSGDAIEGVPNPCRSLVLLYVSPH